MSVVRVSKIRLYPNASQEVVLLDVLRICKDAWNALKTLIQEEYENTGKTLGYYDLCHKLTILKQVERKYQLPHSQVIRNVATRITGVYKSFFPLEKKVLGRDSLDINQLNAIIVSLIHNLGFNLAMTKHSYPRLAP